ncbi:MAG TPA: hypothetical protein VIK84_01605 [Haloplasmataceae bacterium]
MKVYSAVINPIPDEEGYHVFECDKCNHIFLVNLQDTTDHNKLYCPFCGNLGTVITFTNSIREKVFKDHPIGQLQDQVQEGTEANLSLEQVKEIIENFDTSDMDVEVLEYSINEVIPLDELIKYEFICCEKNIKVSMDDYDTVKYCTFCKGEVLLNIRE